MWPFAFFLRWPQDGLLRCSRRGVTSTGSALHWLFILLRLQLCRPSPHRVHGPRVGRLQCHGCGGGDVLLDRRHRNCGFTPPVFRSPLTTSSAWPLGCSATAVVAVMQWWIMVPH